MARDYRDYCWWICLRVRECIQGPGSIQALPSFYFLLSCPLVFSALAHGLTFSQGCMDNTPKSPPRVCAIFLMTIVFQTTAVTCELFKAQYACLIPQNALLNFGLFCQLLAFPSQDCNLRIAAALTFSIHFPLVLLWFLISRGMEYFCSTPISNSSFLQQTLVFNTT